MNRRLAAIALVLVGVLLAMGPATVGLAAQQDSAAVARPMVRGGAYDKPYLFGGSRAALGGYVEAHLRHSRVDGVTEETTFVPKRLNLFLSSQISDFVRFFAEIEFEDGAEEILLEMASVDLLIAREFGVRGGMLLSPLGRFNLSHDSPLNEFTDRPLVSTEVIGVALSEPGLGAFGLVPTGGAGRLTYELYAVNGYSEGVIDDSPDGTRIPNGRRNFKDNNNHPSVVGRVAWSPRLDYEIGVSAHHGPYNVFRLEGQDVDQKRNLSIYVLDFEAKLLGVRLQGEGALARIDIPQSLRPLYARRQQGLFIEGLYDFGNGWIRTMPRSFFSVGARLDLIDLDGDIPGDNVNQISLGFNFRPTTETVFKLNYVRGRARDRFNNSSDFARALFSVATYF